MLRTWNCSNLCLESEGAVLNKKKKLITQCVSSYEEECVKLTCFVCSWP